MVRKRGRISILDKAKMTSVESLDQKDSYQVSGSGGKFYKVDVKRVDDGIVVTCNRIVKGKEVEICPSRLGKHTCYHVLAATMAWERDAGMSAKYFRLEWDAREAVNDMNGLGKIVALYVAKTTLNTKFSPSFWMVYQ